MKWLGTHAHGLLLVYLSDNKGDIGARASNGDSFSVVKNGREESLRCVFFTWVGMY